MKKRRVDMLVPVHDASKALLEKHLRPSLEKFGDDVKLITTINAASAFHAYAEMEHQLDSDDNAAPIRVYTHADVEILDEDLVGKLERVFSENDRVGLVGVIGAISDTCNMHWQAERRAGKVMWGQAPLDFGNMPNAYRTDAALIDGCFMASNKAIKWDTKTYGEGCWHIYDLDICRQIRQQGFKIAISDVQIRHIGRGREDYGPALAKYQRKWR